MLPRVKDRLVWGQISGGGGTIKLTELQIYNLIISERREQPGRGRPHAKRRVYVIILLVLYHVSKEKQPPLVQGYAHF